MVETRPTKIPRWNDTGGNRTEPLEAEKDAGWALNDQPPSSYFNWLQYYQGAWIKWIDERLLTGALQRDLIVTALTPDASGRGGGLKLLAATANTGGDGGSVEITAGDGLSAGGGGAVDLTAGDAPGDGGRVKLQGGNSTSSGRGGNVEITGGAGQTSEGGDVLITGGQTTGGAGAEVQLSGGDAVGTDLGSGNIVMTTGESTGQGGGIVDVFVAERETGGSGSGSYVNTPQRFLRMNGTTNPGFSQHDRFQLFNVPTATDAARGTFRAVQKAQPTGPQKGDFYLDSSSDQCRIHDGVTYRGMTPRVYALDFASTNVTDATATEKTFALSGPADLKYTIPADYINTGAIIRIRAAFGRAGSLSDEPGFRIRLGSYSGITGAILTDIAALAGGASLIAFAIDAEIHLRSGGASGAVRARTVASASDSSGSWNSGQQYSTVLDVTAIAFNTALDLYPTVLWNSVGAGSQWVTCQHFTVDLI